MNDIALIALVRQNEELFNMRNPEYLNQQRRDTVWDEIGNELNETGVAVKERWTRLRENFRKALILRNTKLKTNAKHKYIKPPRYYKELSFLIPHLSDEEKGKFRPKINLFDDLEVTPEYIMESNTKDDTQHTDISMSSTNPNVIIARYSGKRKRRLSASFSSDDQLAALTAAPQDQDVLLEFFINMAKTVKTFPERTQLEIKAQLFQIVNRAEIKLINEGTSSGGIDEDQIKIEPE